MSVAMTVCDIPDEHRALTERFVAGLRDAIGEKVRSVFLYGAAMFPRPPAWKLDYDFHALVDPLDAEEADAIRTLHAALEATYCTELDGYYVLLTDARSSAIPRHQVLADVVDAAWALHRAHVHARRYVCVEGLDPVDIVPRPTWSELRVALDHEMTFLTERNFDISDDAAYAVLNAARVLVSHRTRDVAISKYACGASLAESEARWRSTLDAALRRYQRHDVPIPDARAFVDWVRGLTAEP
jgi:hypothetical protein